LDFAEPAPIGRAAAPARAVAITAKGEVRHNATERTASSPPLELAPGPDIAGSPAFR
jgi:hypothetical protein